MSYFLPGSLLIHLFLLILMKIELHMLLQLKQTSFCLSSDFDDNGTGHVVSTKNTSFVFFIWFLSWNDQVLDKSLQSIGLKDAVSDLREVARDMKETSDRMQNATLAFVEGQKNGEFKKGNQARKACKRFRWNRNQFRRCLRRKGRSPKSNVTSTTFQKNILVCILSI